MMNKGIIYLMVSMTFGIVGITIFYPTIPPPEKTGAPGEGTCFNCHFYEDTLNGGQGSINIIFNDSINFYQPDSIYNISVTVEENTQKIFGFELTVLDSGKTKTGEIIITDSSNTSLSTANGRDYISHYDAWDPQNTGQGNFTWQFQWKAPLSNMGPVKFYSAGVAASSMVFVAAGNVYTTMLTIEPDSTVGIVTLNLQDNSLTIHPNPANDILYINYSILKRSVVETRLLNIKGQVVYQSRSENVSGKYNKQINIKDFTNGIYFLQFITNIAVINKKIIIQHAVWIW